MIALIIIFNNILLNLSIILTYHIFLPDYISIYQISFIYYWKLAFFCYITKTGQFAIILLKNILAYHFITIFILIY